MGGLELAGVRTSISRGGRPDSSSRRRAAASRVAGVAGFAAVVMWFSLSDVVVVGRFPGGDGRVSTAHSGTGSPKASAVHRRRRRPGAAFRVVSPRGR